MVNSDARAGFVGYWLPVLLWMALIMVGTSLPRPPHLGVESGDKLAHLVAYGVLGVLLMRAFRFAAACPWWQAALASVLFGTAYGVLDEVHQAFLPSRTCSVEDLVADVMGLIAAALVTWVIGCRIGRSEVREQMKIRDRGDDVHV